MVATLLVGCQSEVDKCVSAEMKAWKVVNDAARKHNEINKAANEKAESHNKKIYEELEKPWNQNYGSLKSDKKISEQDFVPFEALGFKKVDRRLVDETPVEVVEANKRKMCMQIGK